MERIAFFVTGDPKTQGSMRVRVDGQGHPFVTPDNSKDLKVWRKAVADTARFVSGYGTTIDEPLRVILTFYLPKPKSRPKKDRFADRKPDLDKLVRAVLDALSKDAPLIREDSRVVSIMATKVFAEEGAPTGVHVTLEPVE